MHPTLVRRVLLPLHEFLLGRGTCDYFEALDQSQWWSLERLQALQRCKLRRLLVHAAERLPIYRERIAAADIRPEVAELTDLLRLPTLSKDDIRQAGDALCWPAVPGGLRPYTTGGSTGEPLQFHIDRGRAAADQAARWRSRRWFGIEPGDRELYLWGSPIELSRQDRARMVRDRLLNHRLLSAFDLTADRMTAFLHEVDRFEPVHIFGYPSSLARVAGHGRERGIQPRTDSLKAVFTSGECIDAVDRAAIQSFFNAPVADGYGSRDAGFVAHECPYGRMHLTAESLIVELLDDRGEPVGAGDAGEVVVTHLDALGMPFIRYRTGDMARLDGRRCPCGRAHPTLRTIEGRRTDMLRTADGGCAHALAVIYVLREQPAVRRFQVIQRRSLELDVAVEAASPIDAATHDRMVGALSKQLGGVPVRLRLVDRIAPEASGKFRYVTSEA